MILLCMCCYFVRKLSHICVPICEPCSFDDQTITKISTWWPVRLNDRQGKCVPIVLRALHTAIIVVAHRQTDRVVDT